MLAYAKEYALGGHAIAEHANDAEAQEYVKTSAVGFGRTLMQHSRWLLILIFLPVVARWWNRRRDRVPPPDPPQA